MSLQTTRHPLPAPLPGSSRASRGEIPTFDPYGLNDRDEDPRAPLMREDDFTLVLCGSMVGFFIVIMVIVAAMGGL